MTITLNGTNGVVTPGVENTAAESVATTLAVTGATTMGSTLAVTGAATVGGNLTATGYVRGSGLTTNIYPLVSDSVQLSLSTTIVDFTGIPSWVKRITVMFSAVSFSGSDELVVRLGTSGGVEDTDYESCATSGAGTAAVYTLGFLQTNGITSGNTMSGMCVLENISANAWVQSGNVSRYSSGGTNTSSGRIVLASELTTVRVTGSLGGGFDSGSVNILYE